MVMKGLFSTKSDTPRVSDYENIENGLPVASAEPPIVTATAVAASLPSVEEARFNASHAKTMAGGIEHEAPLDRHPTQLRICPNCSTSNVGTRTQTYPSWETWLLCGSIALFFVPACWIPLVMDSTKRTDHLCNHCHAVVGTVKPFSDCCVKERG
mmetsp:Transcript_21533/g.49364  ORF Transcript_21533/g.49364 Transcript_21533/m.49364 type:complete len:155 (+) Transcript_21533:128-592(+)